MRRLSSQCPPVRSSPASPPAFRDHEDLPGCAGATCIWRLIAAVALLALLECTRAHATEVIRWQRLPIELALHVGQERIVFVDRPIRVAVPSGIVEHLRVQSADGAIYLRASAPFETTRVALQDADTGALVLLDVTATAVAPEEKLEPVRIVLTKSSQDTAESDSQGESSNNDKESPAGTATPSAVLLTRYAAQSLYAPLRTVEPVAGIIAMPVKTGLDLTTLLPALSVKVTALAAWRLQDQWVTAARITNLTTTWLQLDPRMLQGDFIAATFQHRQLGPQGASTDTTVLYLITRGHGLAESLLPAISPVDAAANLSTPAASEASREK